MFRMLAARSCLDSAAASDRRRAARAGVTIAACGTRASQTSEIDSPTTARRASCSPSTARAATRSTVAGTAGLRRRSPNGSRAQGRPELQLRKETKDQVLYAIRNGGFSARSMPQNIVVGAGRAGRRGVRRQVRGQRCQTRHPRIDARRSGSYAKPSRRAERPARRRVLDLKADPRRSRRRCAPRSRAAATAPTRARPRCSRSTRAGASSCRRSRRCARAERGLGGDRRGQAGAARTRRARSREMQEVGARGKALDEELDGVQAELDARARPAAEPARPDAPPTRTRSLREVGERSAPTRRATTSSSPAR